MQQPRKTLSARLARTEDLTGPLADLPPMIVEAITRKICIAVVYNKTPMTLAPQIAYTKHDDLFIDAVVVEREGKPPKEIKLSTFKQRLSIQLQIYRNRPIKNHLLPPNWSCALMDRHKNYHSLEQLHCILYTHPLSCR